MPNRPCPNCQLSTIRDIDDCRNSTAVSYYYCESCGYSWSYPAGQETTAEPTTVITKKKVESVE